MEYTSKCAVCEKVFTSKNWNEKYCSPLCRASGSKKVREEWEKSNDYKSKQRERMRHKRKEERNAMQQHRQNKRKKIAESSNNENEHREEQRLSALQSKAKKGDLNALQQLALHQGDALEYWRLYKEKILESEKKFGCGGIHLVGGIDIYENNFEFLVLEQLQKRKKE